MKNQKEKDDKSNAIPLLLLLLSGFFVFLFFLPEEKPLSPAARVQSKEFEDRVNKHLFHTSQKIEHTREKMRLETFELSQKGVKSAGPPIPQGGLDLSTDPRVEALVRDLDRDAKESGGPKNPNELIQMELFEQEQFAQYSEEYKKEYARQFVENAKKAGYRIILNDQYKVISVVPIRKPAQDFKLFDSRGGTAQ